MGTFLSGTGCLQGRLGGLQVWVKVGMEGQTLLAAGCEGAGQGRGPGCWGHNDLGTKASCWAVVWPGKGLSASSEMG